MSWARCLGPSAAIDVEKQDLDSTSETPAGLLGVVAVFFWWTRYQYWYPEGHLKPRAPEQIEAKRIINGGDTINTIQCSGRLYIS